MAFDLSEKRFDDKEVKVFNNGEAGIVKNCSVRIEKKSADESENAPDYRLIVTDENGGEVNRAYFKRGLDDIEGTREEMFGRELKHLAKVFRVEDKAVKAYKSPTEALDGVLKCCHDNQNNIKVNVAVCYGTTTRPRRFLEIDGFWGIKNVEDGVPRLSSKALTTRPEPDPEEGMNMRASGGSEDTEGFTSDGPATDGWL